MKFLLSVLSILVINFSFLNAGDWPSWRGTARDDVSTEKGLLKSWPSGGPKKEWMSNDAGLGYAGFSVAMEPCIPWVRLAELKINCLSCSL